MNVDERTAEHTGQLRAAGLRVTQPRLTILAALADQPMPQWERDDLLVNFSDAFKQCDKQSPSAWLPT